jgi:hypothetical protein
MPAKYSVFSIRLKEIPEWVPFGIVMWSQELDWVCVRTISGSERPSKLPKEDFQLIDTLRKDLDLCQSAEYISNHKFPKSSMDEFWEIIRTSLTLRFRLSQEFKVLRDNLEGELVDLFHKIVAPTIDPADWTRDSVIIDE